MLKFLTLYHEIQNAPIYIGGEGNGSVVIFDVIDALGQLDLEPAGVLFFNPLLDQAD